MSPDAKRTSNGFRAAEALRDMKSSKKLGLVLLSMVALGCYDPAGSPAKTKSENDRSGKSSLAPYQNQTASSPYNSGTAVPQAVKQPGWERVFGISIINPKGKGDNGVRWLTIYPSRNTKSEYWVIIQSWSQTLGSVRQSMKLSYMNDRTERDVYWYTSSEPQEVLNYRYSQTLRQARIFLDSDTRIGVSIWGYDIDQFPSEWTPICRLEGNGDFNLDQLYSPSDQMGCVAISDGRYNFLPFTSMIATDLHGNRLASSFQSIEGIGQKAILVKPGQGSDIDLRFRTQNLQPWQLDIYGKN